MFTFPRAVALATGGRAVAWFGEVTIRSDAGLGMQTPEQAIIRLRNRWVWLGQDELSFPPQRRAKIGMVRIEAIPILSD